VYILKCNDGSYYTGITNDIDRRFQEHQSGYDQKAYTFSRRLLLLVFKAEYLSPDIAISFEKKIQKWSKAKKEALINECFDDLPALSKRNLNKDCLSSRYEQSSTRTDNYHFNKLYYKCT
jgi:putative endonuclease